MMAIFENFPYTNFHEINLDWVIKAVKDYVDRIDKMEINFADLKTYVENYFADLDVQDEIDDKLDRMAADGTLAAVIAQYLGTEALIVFNTKQDMKDADNLTNGMTVMQLGESVYNDGFTVLYKIRTLTSADRIDDNTIVALANYPTLIAERISSSGADSSIGRTVSPIYLGEHITEPDQYPTGVLRVGDTIYYFTFTANMDNSDVYMFSALSNTFISSKTIRCGHCNSVAYDPENEVIYLVPVNDYSGGSELLTTNIYKYDLQLNLIGTVTAPEVMFAISYDNVTGTMYTLAKDTYNLYRVVEDQFSLIATVEPPELNFINSLDTYNNKEYNQDIAVRSNILYLSSPFSVIAAWNITNMTKVDSITLTAEDADARYYMGELEGMEFYNDHLLAVRFTTVRNQAQLGFVVEIPLGSSYAAPYPHRDAVQPSLILSDETQTKFCLPPWQIKSLLSLQARPYRGFYRVSITGAVVDDYVIQLHDDLALVLNSGATYTCKYIQVITGTLTFQGPGELITTAPRNGTDSLVLEQGVQVFFAVASLRVRPTGNNFVIQSPAYASMLIYKANIINNAGGSVMIGSTALTKGLWVGSELIAALA